MVTKTPTATSGTATAPATRKMKLSQICTDGGTQMRHKIDSDVVAMYADAITNIGEDDRETSFTRVAWPGPADDARWDQADMAGAVQTRDDESMQPVTQQ